MPRVPAWCPHCGALFESGFAFEGEGANATLTGNMQTCVNCGQMARVLDGHWTVTGGVMNLLAGPQWSRDRLQTFLDRLLASRTAAGAWDLVEREAPEVAAAVQEAVTHRSKGLSKEERFWLMLAVLLQVLQIVLQTAQGSPQMSPEQIDYIVDRSMQSYEDVRETPPTNGPSSTPPAPDEQTPPDEEPPGHQLGSQT